MAIDELVKLMKRKGFRDTFKVLSQFDEYKTDKRSFYDELNKFSYYNSYFRVKEDLVNKGLIEIVKEENNGKKSIKLTKKGVNVYDKLTEINEMINQ